MAKVKKHPYAGKRGPDRDFIKLVDELARYRRHSEVFNDFLEMAYCAVAKTTYPPGHEAADALEERYMRVVKRNDEKYIRLMPELLGTFAVGIDSVGGDFLGRISGEIGALHDGLGQFFTPFEVSKMMAIMTLDNDETRAIVERQGFVTMCEPACGAGGMVLAAAEVLDEMGLDPSICLWVQATDVSDTAYKMAYLQLAACNIPADVIRGDSIRMESWEAAITPAKISFVLHHGERWRAWCESSWASAEQTIAEKAERLALPAPAAVAKSVGQPNPKKAPIRQPATSQLSLFG